MPNPEVNSREFSTLGPRIRAARKQLGLTQEDVGDPHFTKSYISAIERNKVHPSLKALNLIAERLAIPVHELLQVEQAEEQGVIAQAEQEMRWSLSQAKWLIETQQAQQALDTLDRAEAQHSAHLEQLSDLNRYRLRRLRANAFLALKNLSRALEELNAALAMARELADGAEEVELVSNLLGVAYFQQGHIHRALDEHKRCLTAVESGVVKQLSLKLDIYDNLANEYRALNDFSQAASIHEAALRLTEGVSSLEEQANSYWQASVGFQNSGNQAHAVLYGVKAVAMLEAAHNMNSAAWTKIELADLALLRYDYAAAEKWLQQASQATPNSGSELVRSSLQERYARLELHRSNIAPAFAYAESSSALANSLIEQQTTSGSAPQEKSLLAYALALRTSALVAEAQGRKDDAGRLLGQAIDMLSKTSYTAIQSEVEFNFAELLQARDDHQAAGEHYRAAYALRRQSR